MQKQTKSIAVLNEDVNLEARFAMASDDDKFKEEDDQEMVDLPRSKVPPLPPVSQHRSTSQQPAEEDKDRPVFMNKKSLKVPDSAKPGRKQLTSIMRRTSTLGNLNS